MSNLLTRVAIGIPAAAVALGITWLGGWYFVGMAVVLLFFLQREIRRMLSNAGYQTDLFFSYVIGLYVIFIPWLPYPFEIAILILLLFTAWQAFKSKKQHLQELIATFFCGIYIPFGLLSLILVRLIEVGQSGFLLTITFLLMMWGNDICAYLGGKKWGRHLLAPDISPKKTWEGFFFGFLGAGIGLAVMLPLLSDVIPWVALIPAVIVVSIFGPLGDLLESKLKRAAGMKDSSTILPGHGGFFDRMDALVLAAPAFYLYIKFLVILGAIAF